MYAPASPFEQNGLVMFLLYSSIILIGYLLAMALFGLVILPMQLSKNDTTTMLRRAAGLASFPAGIIGLPLVSYYIYSIVKAYNAIVEMSGSMQEAMQNMGGSDSSISSAVPYQAPSIWSMFPIWQTLVFGSIFIFSILMIIPRVRKSLAMYSILVVLNVGFWVYIIVLLKIFLSADIFSALGEVPGFAWALFLVGVFGYILFFVLAYVVGKGRMQTEQAINSANEMQQSFPPQDFQNPYPPQNQPPQNFNQQNDQSQFPPTQPPVG